MNDRRQERPHNRRRLGVGLLKLALLTHPPHQRREYEREIETDFLQMTEDRRRTGGRLQAAQLAIEIVADAPEGLIRIENNLAVIDYSKNQLATRLPTQRCPTGSIVWLEGRSVLKGDAAKRIIRQDPLPLRNDFQGNN